MRVVKPLAESPYHFDPDRPHLRQMVDDLTHYHLDNGVLVSVLYCRNGSRMWEVLIGAATDGYPIIYCDDEEQALAIRDEVAEQSREVIVL